MKCLFKKDYSLIDRNDALSAIHFAKDVAHLKEATYRLKFDEHLFLELLAKSISLTKTEKLRTDEAKKPSITAPPKKSAPFKIVFIFFM